jgi:hypothetical protein
MRRTKRDFAPILDPAEPRVLLSGGHALLSRPALNIVVHDLERIVTSLAKTHDTATASASLNSLASRIPSGSTGLAPSWQIDLTLYNPNARRSVAAVKRHLVSDLDWYVEGGTQPTTPSPATPTGSAPTTPSPTGPTGSTSGTGGSSNPTPPTTPAPALDSVGIENTTGLALTVTITLETGQRLQPSITETIPAQGDAVVPFDFGTSTNALMSMSVSLANGGQSPPAWTDASLSQPISGYDGTVFQISLFGPYFNVTTV